MKITFVKDCPPIIPSGNSTYVAGDEADLRRGKELVAMGYAYEGWGKQDSPPPPVVPLSELSLAALRLRAKEAGIPNYSRMKKTTLIEKLGG